MVEYLHLLDGAALRNCLYLLSEYLVRILPFQLRRFYDNFHCHARYIDDYHDKNHYNVYCHCY